MDQWSERRDIQDMAISLASVSRNSKHLDVLIFGAGCGGLATLKVLGRFQNATIHAIVDIVEEAPAFELAQEMNVPTLTDSDAALESFDGDVVIDVTGDPNLYEKLLEFTRPHHIELISAKSAKLLFELASKELEDEQIIGAQKTRLSLLDGMLEISSQLENRLPLAEIMSKAMVYLHACVRGANALAVTVDSDWSCKIVGCAGMEKPVWSPSAGTILQKTFQDMPEKHRVIILPDPVELCSPESLVTYDVVLPVWYQYRLSGVLLFKLCSTLSREHKTMLNMASIHLNMVAKTVMDIRRLEKIAIHDGLTGMFNRRYFDQKIEKEVNRIKRNKNGTLTCAFIDVDDFKNVNDTYGHSIGDKVLIEISNSISRSIRDYDICARYGGDEFVVLMPADIMGEQVHLEKIGQRILKHISEITIQGLPDIKLGVSIGMAIQAADTLDVDKLMKMADSAVYHAKKAGKSCLNINSDADHLFRRYNKNIYAEKARLFLLATESLPKKVGTM